MRCPSYEIPDPQADDVAEEITLPESLWQQMDELWERSIAHIAEGRVSEWGGVLVLDEQDNLKLVNIP